MQLRDQLPHANLVNTANIFNMFIIYFINPDLVHVLGDKVKKEEVAQLLDRVQVGVGQDVHDLVPPDSACPGLEQDL